METLRVNFNGVVAHAARINIIMREKVLIALKILNVERVCGRTPLSRATAHSPARAYYSKNELTPNTADHVIVGRARIIHNNNNNNIYNILLYSTSPCTHTTTSGI